MKVVIAGGSGMVGTSLNGFLTQKGHTVHVLSRSAGDPLYRWDPEKGVMNSAALDEVDVIVNLTGANVMAQKWTEAYKKELVNSRIQSARTLGNALAKAAKRKRYWIQASGVGYYPHSNELMTEESPRGRDFLAGLCEDWERSAEQFRNEDLKVAVVRIGVVLKKDEGFLGKLVPLAKWGLSSAFGDGKQHLSWIHIHDLCGIVNFLAEKQTEGIFNAVSDEPVSNRDMTAAIARSVERPFFFPAVPKKALTLLMGEMGEELLANHRVSNNKIKKAGYTFEYPGLREALRSAVDS